MSEQNKMEELKRLLDNVADRIEQEFSDYDTVTGPSLIYPMRISDMPDNISNACWKAEHDSYYNVNNDIELINDECSINVIIQHEQNNREEVYNNIKQLLYGQSSNDFSEVYTICKKIYTDYFGYIDNFDTQVEKFQKDNPNCSGIEAMIRVVAIQAHVEGYESGFNDPNGARPE